jgi:hypothetical protein
MLVMMPVSGVVMAGAAGLRLAYVCLLGSLHTALRALETYTL